MKEEIQGRDVSVIFDGTTHLGEAMAVVWTVTGEYNKGLFDYCY